MFLVECYMTIMVIHVFMCKVTIGLTNMSISLLNLEDRIITDTGSMIAKYDLLLSLALSGEPFAHLPAVPHDDLAKYHHNKGTLDSAKVWVDDGVIQGPSIKTFAWITPPPYVTMDIADRCMTMMLDRSLDTPTYMDRLVDEIALMYARDMEPFVRCVVWITDMMRKKDIVWGLGRGSSCASLILFVLGINKVDPVRYDIPKEEFYK